MIGAVAGEIAVGIAETGELSRVLGAAGIIHYVGYAEAEQADVKTNAVFHVRQIETEMAEATDLEGLVEQDSADVEFAVGARHRIPPRSVRPVYTIFFPDSQRDSSISLARTSRVNYQ